MEKSIIKTISQKIYRQYPEVKDKHPSVKTQSPDNTLLVYKGEAVTVDGKTINRTIRVVIDRKGKIIKTTTSR